MTEADDPTHPLYPAFDSLNDIPATSWMVIYEGLSSHWLATSPFYNYDSAVRMASLFDRGVRIVELRTYQIEDVPMDVRLANRKKNKTTPRTMEPQPKVRRVRKVKPQVEEEIEPDDGVPEGPPPKKMKVRKVRKATQAPLFDEE